MVSKQQSTPRSLVPSPDGEPGHVRTIIVGAGFSGMGVAHGLLEAGRADLGVCIHEGRFTYAERGLARVEDLGERWEAATGTPLPLGGIAARRALGPEVAGRVQAVVRSSLEWALAHRSACEETMRRHAQELEPSVLWAHVDLYVNDWTLDLGEEGRAALAALARLAEERGLIEPGVRLAVL